MVSGSGCSHGTSPRVRSWTWHRAAGARQVRGRCAAGAGLPARDGALRAPLAGSLRKRQRQAAVQSPVPSSAQGRCCVEASGPRRGRGGPGGLDPGRAVGSAATGTVQQAKATTTWPPQSRGARAGARGPQTRERGPHGARPSPRAPSSERRRGRKVCRCEGDPACHLTEPACVRGKGCNRISEEAPGVSSPDTRAGTPASHCALRCRPLLCGGVRGGEGASSF